jgi:hypothetical protein
MDYLYIKKINFKVPFRLNSPQPCKNLNVFLVNKLENDPPGRSSPFLGPHMGNFKSGTCPSMFPQILAR